MNAQMIPRASAPFRSNAVEYAGPPIAWMWSASSCRTSGWPSALFAVPQLIAPLTTVQMSWSSASGDDDHVGRVEIDHDLVRDLALPLLVLGVARRRIVERRRDAGAAGVAEEVAAVVRVVAVVVEVLHVEVRDRVRLRAVERLRRVVRRRVGAVDDLRLARRRHGVLAEGEEDAARHRVAASFWNVCTCVSFAVGRRP